MEYNIRLRVHSSFENSKFPKFHLSSPLDFDIINNEFELGTFRSLEQ